MVSTETGVLRELAERYMAVCARAEQASRRDAWRRHNSFQSRRPLIYVRAFAWQEIPDSHCICEDPLFRQYEDFFRNRLYWAGLNDDSVFEPWVTVEAATITPPEGVWGLPCRWKSSREPRGARVMDPAMASLADAERLIKPHHVVDEAETERRAAQLHDAIGDIVPICVDRAPAYRVWNADISTQLAQLRGIEQLMLDMLENPDWLHGVLAFMRDGILQTHKEAEEAGDWTLAAHENQAMPYAEELRDPAPDSHSVTRKDLWCFCASQETTLLGPGLFDEFMFHYQRAILEPFGLVAYGCCEDLTLKIDVLRQLPNLRRIAVSPMANAARCAEHIGPDYILSYRPSPSDMVGYDFDPERIRRILRRDLGACQANGCHADITLKDVETVQYDAQRAPRWVEITRGIIDEFAW